MSQKSIILILIVFALIVVGMFVYASMKKTELQETRNLALGTTVFNYVHEA